MDQGKELSGSHTEPEQSNQVTQQAYAYQQGCFYFCPGAKANSLAKASQASASLASLRLLGLLGEF